MKLPTYDFFAYGIPLDVGGIAIGFCTAILSMHFLLKTNSIFFVGLFLSSEPVSNNLWVGECS
jgi:hypothetical protein